MPSVATQQTESGSQPDVEVGQVDSSAQNYGWERGLSPRAVIMLSLGGGIGLGLWIGTGTALSAAGPAGCAIAYMLVALAIYIEFLSIGEMTCYKPISGGYIRQGMEYVDKAAAFAMGMNLWFSWTMTVPAEIIACINVLQYWEAPRNFPMAAYITIFAIVSAVPNLFAVRKYGSVEVVMSSLKVFSILSTMCFLFIMASGGLPSQEGPLVFHYWKNPGAFNNGMKGICRAILQAAFSCPSAGWVAIVAGEMKDPRRTVRRSVNPLFWRMFAFYVVNIWLIGMCVPYNHPDLQGSGTLASPFILAIRDGGAPVFAHIINGLVFITVLSCGITSYYVASRCLTHIADLEIIHPWFGKKDAAGRPWLSLILSGLLGGGLTYLNLNNTSAQVYNWFSNLVGVSSFCNWFLIYVAHIRFRQGLSVQGIDYRTLPFRDRFAPYSQYLGLILIIIFLIAQLYFAIFPFTGKPSAENFFSTYITVPLFLLDYVLYKFWFKTKIVAPKDMDFTPAKYFDKIDEDEKEAKRLDPTPKKSFLGRVWRLRTAIV
ncbi:amino acid permease/ SLC12A domain-containing protein [Aspergillus pseudoustus]|uniref:Amino acid permease/ SLC12A domain-containing protein n=1 Tax=Aspergillus pseudoustus TaxID=1810923 RepID=A0ABR4KHA2_9EURO